MREGMGGPMRNERPSRPTAPAAPGDLDEYAHLELEVVEHDGTRSRVICAAIEGNASPPRGTRRPG